MVNPVKSIGQAAGTAKGIFSGIRGTRAAGAATRRGGSGLLGKGLAGYGIYNIGKNLFGGGQEEDPMMGGSGGQTDGGVFGAGMGRSNTMVTAAGATSILSDADSSDPVVRQLQDIERVLVSIKGDTAQFVSGIGARMPQAPNMQSLRAGFGGMGGAAGGALKGLGGLLAALAGIGLGTKFAQNMVDDMDNQQGSFAPLPSDPVDRAVSSLGTQTGEFAESALPKLAGAALETGTGKKLRDKTAAAAGELAENTRRPPPSPNVDPATGGTDVKRPPPAMRDTGLLGPDGKPLQVPVDPPPVVGPTSEVPNAAAPSANDAAPESKRAKITTLVTAGAGELVTKGIPLVGAVANLAFAGEKLAKGDFLGSGMELISTFLPSVSGSGVDLASMVRDIYKDVHGNFPEQEEDLETVQRRMGEITALLQAAISRKLNSVRARPDSIKRMRGPNVNVKRARLARQQEMWDEKYGQTHNPDGTPKELEGNTVEPVPPSPAAIEAMDGQSGVTPLPAATQLNDSAQVDSLSEQVTSNQREQDQLVLTTALSQGVAAQGQNTQTFTPEVSVNVIQPKTSFPRQNAELEFINSNGQHLT